MLLDTEEQPQSLMRESNALGNLLNSKESGEANVLSSVARLQTCNEHAMWHIRDRIQQASSMSATCTINKPLQEQQREEEETFSLLFDAFCVNEGMTEDPFQPLPMLEEPPKFQQPPSTISLPATGRLVSW
jgi:hypothetical protein